MQYRFARMLAGMRRALELLGQNADRLKKVATEGGPVALQQAVDAHAALAQAQSAHRGRRDFHILPQLATSSA